MVEKNRLLPQNYPDLTAVAGMPRLHRYKALPADRFVPLAQEIIKGESIDWPNATREDMSERFNSPFGVIPRLIASMSQLSGEESNTAYGFLADDLRGFTRDPGIFQSPLQKEWFYKLMVGIKAVGIIDAVPIGARRSTNLSPREREYADLVSGQTTVLTGILRGLDKTDLTHFIKFTDLYLGLVLNKTTVPQRLAGWQRRIERESLDIGDLLKEEIYQAQVFAWERLKKGWGWTEIMQVAGLIGQVDLGKDVVAYSLAAMEENLRSSKKLKDSPKTLGEGVARGIMEMLRFRWTDQGLADVFNEDAGNSRFLEGLETKLEFPDFAVPRKYLPTTAIELLRRFPGALEQVHWLAATEKDVLSPWFLTLLSLQKLNPETGGTIDSLVDKWTGFPAHIRDIFRDREPGRLWLDDGRIRSTGAGVNLRSAYPIYRSYISSAILIQNTMSVSQEKGSPARQPEGFTAQRIDKLPFFGEVGIVEKDTEVFIKSLFKQANSGVSGVSEKYHTFLLQEFDRLQQNWGRFSDNGLRLLYLTGLNLGSPYLDKIKELRLKGLTAVQIEGRRAVFVFSGDKGPIPLAIQGELDENGQLNILGTNDSFIGEPEQLALNNLALYLATQDLYRIGDDKYKDNRMLKDIHEVEATWNRAMRDSLPKIGSGDTTAFALPVWVKGFDRPVLFSAIK